MLSAKESFLKLESLVKKKGLSFYRLGLEIKMPSSFFSEWKKGKMMPKADKLKILAEYFRVPIEYFLE